MQEYLQNILNLDGDADDGDLEAQEMCNCLQDAYLERASSHTQKSGYTNDAVVEIYRRERTHDVHQGVLRE